MGLFQQADLETHIFALTLEDDYLRRGLNTLARLQHLYRIGYWSTLRESNIEQSFVERIFSEVFGYRTLLSDPTTDDASAEVLPKLYVPLADERAFPDFALGHFRADVRETVVTAELKGPGADLDKPQGGRYGGRSPVQQAMAAAIGAHAEWCIVSDTTEVRLYRVPDEAAYEKVQLLDVVSSHQFRRAYALLGRRSLLGNARTSESPLSRLYRHMAQGEGMLVPPREGRVRLVQRVRPKTGEFPFTRLSARLADALAAVPIMNIMSGDFVRPTYHGDILTFDRTEGGETWQRVAMSKTGLLVCSFAVPVSDAQPQPGQPILVDPGEVLWRLADMAALAWQFFKHLTNQALVFEWSLEDLTPQVRADDKDQWTRPSRYVRLTCHDGVPRTVFPEVSWNHKSGVARTEMVRILGEAVRELFFPFDGISDADHQLCRLEPTDEEIAARLESNPSLKVFP